MMNSQPFSPTNRRDDATKTAPGTTGTIEKPRAIRAIWPGEWWIVVNLYLLVIVLLAVAGSALEI
jgi:hypothetical protein